MHATQAARIGKLFAKHLKQAEQEAMLASTVMHLGVGTPNRLLKLAQSGALKLDRLQYIVLDVQQDVKRRCGRGGMVSVGGNRTSAARLRTGGSLDPRPLAPTASWARPTFTAAGQACKTHPPNPFRRTVLDMPETKSDFWKLFEDFLRSAAARGARFVLWGRRQGT